MNIFRTYLQIVSNQWSTRCDLRAQQLTQQGYVRAVVEKLTLYTVLPLEYLHLYYASTY